MTLTQGKKNAFLARMKVAGRKTQKSVELPENYDPSELPDYGPVARLLIANGTLDEEELVEELVKDIERPVREL